MFAIDFFSSAFFLPFSCISSSDTCRYTFLFVCNTIRQLCSGETHVFIPTSECLALIQPIYLCPVTSGVSDSLRPHGLWPARLLCPWGSPGENTGVGCHSLLQGIFLTQGSNLRLLWQMDSLWLAPPGKLLFLLKGRYFSSGHSGPK